MHSHLCSVFLLAFVYTAPGQPTPIPMGTFGPNSYYYDNELRTWQESRDYCQSLGMDLASLPTPDHFIFVTEYAELNAIFNSVERHWTSAQHSMNVTQFLWSDNLESQVSADFPSGGIIGPKFCFYFDRSRKLKGGLENIQVGVMCQT